MPFTKGGQKGEKYHRGGRPMGSKDVATIEVKETCREIVRNKAYRKAVAARMLEGTAGALENLIWSYAFGKPKEHLAVELNLGQFSDEELELFERFIKRAS